MRIQTVLALSVCLFFSAGIFLEPANAAKKKSQTSSFPASRSPTGTKVFLFESNRLKWGIYDQKGKLVRTGHGVAGKAYCPDVKRGCKTPFGTYRIYNKVGPNFRSTRYPLPNGGAPMPWGMFFHKGYAIHGSNNVPNKHASHGCIRVSNADARWLNQNLPIGTTVIVRPY